ncbi:MAG: flagellin, partial [Oscillospiraceae bacterium]
MGMVVRTNTMSSNAYRQLGMNNTQLSKSLEKLSSGFRINRAGDDSSGLAISEKMKSQIAGLEQASSNSQDGISLVQTAEGALTEVHSMLNRMITLATKSANGTIQNQVDRDAIQSEVDALKDEISRVAQSTDFNGIKLLDGKLGGYNGALDSDNAAKIDALTVTGGNLANNDSIDLNWDDDASKYTVSQLNGTTLPEGVTFDTTEKNGVYTIKANVAKETATAASAEKYEGLTITFKPTAALSAEDATS